MAPKNKEVQIRDITIAIAGISFSKERVAGNVVSEDELHWRLKDHGVTRPYIHEVLYGAECITSKTVLVEVGDKTSTDFPIEGLRTESPGNMAEYCQLKECPVLPHCFMAMYSKNSFEASKTIPDYLKDTVLKI